MWTLSECQTVWIQIRTGIMPKVATSKEKSYLQKQNYLAYNNTYIKHQLWQWPTFSRRDQHSVLHMYTWLYSVDGSRSRWYEIWLCIHHPATPLCESCHVAEWFLEVSRWSQLPGYCLLLYRSRSMSRQLLLLVLRWLWQILEQLKNNMLNKYDD